MFYESLDDNDVYRLLVDIDSAAVLKWDRNSNNNPRKTIGVPSNEQINSPVTFGDHKIVARIRKKQSYLFFIKIILMGT